LFFFLSFFLSVSPGKKQKEKKGKKDLRRHSQEKKSDDS